MPRNFKDLRERMSLVSGFVPLVQIDVMDGVFVPNKSWPYIKKPDPDFLKILNEENSFPYWEELFFEVDLMVSNPAVLVPEWITAGTKRLIVHIESVSDPRPVFEKIKNLLPVRNSFLYTEIGVAINPDTPNEKLEPVMEYVDFVQFMGIAKIGFQGQVFDERVFGKISGLRVNRPNVIISVDGGVNLDTVPELIKAGANRLVAGSAIFERDDVAVTIEKFFGLADEAALDGDK